MEISDFDPSKLTTSDAKHVASELVTANEQGIDYVRAIVAGPAVDRVLANEQEYSKVYRPIIKRGVNEVAANQMELEQIDAAIIAKAMALVQRNAGIVSTTLAPFRGKTYEFSGHADSDGTFLRGRQQPTATAVAGGPVDGPQPIGAIATIGQPGLPTVQPIAVVQLPNGGTGTTPPAPVATINGVPATITTASQPIAPTAIGNGTATCRPPIQVGPCGWPDAVYHPPTCPVGYTPSWDLYRECWECVDAVCGTYGQPPPQPRPLPRPKPVPSCIDMSGNPCPPGQEWTYTYPPGVVECHPVPVVDPLCPRPVGGCPEGMDWWNDPTTGVWHCTPDGGPIPKPEPKPTPSCQQLMDRMGIVLNVECADLPETLRKTLQDCGYLACQTQSTDDYGASEFEGSLWALLEPIEETLIGEQF